MAFDGEMAAQSPKQLSSDQETQLNTYISQIQNSIMNNTGMHSFLNKGSLDESYVDSD